MAKKLYRVKMVVDTVVYLSEKESKDLNTVIDACEDAFEESSQGTTIIINEIDWTKPVRPQLPEQFVDPDLVPENGGPTISEIAKKNDHEEKWISFRP